MKLTAKQEAFAQNVARGMTQADAYRNAYNAENMKPGTVQVKASELMANGKVAVRVGELKAELAAKKLWTREKSTRHWLSVIEDDTGEYKGSDKVNAGKQLDRTHGFEQLNLDHTTGGEPIDSIEVTIVGSKTKD